MYTHVQPHIKDNASRPRRVGAGRWAAPALDKGIDRCVCIYIYIYICIYIYIYIERESVREREKHIYIYIYI